MMDNGIVWKRLNGIIVGCEKEGIEYNLMAITQNTILHHFYHKELQKDAEEGEPK